MPDQFTAGTLRTHITGVALPWSTSPNLADNTPIVTHSLGGDPTNLRRATDIPALNLRQILLPAPNDFILERRKALGFVDPATVIPRQPVRGPLDVALDVAITPGAAVGTAPAVDWRVRWGWPWITTVQDQDGCEILLGLLRHCRCREHGANRAFRLEQALRGRCSRRHGSQVRERWRPRRGAQLDRCERNLRSRMLPVAYKRSALHADARSRWTHRQDFSSRGTRQHRRPEEMARYCRSARSSLSPFTTTSMDTRVEYILRARPALPITFAATTASASSAMTIPNRRG